MNEKHTALPWVAKQYEDGFWGIRNAQFSICIITVQDMDDRKHGEESANAALISRACNSHHALLRFAEEMVERYPSSPWITEQGKAAIAKAKEQYNATPNN